MGFNEVPDQRYTVTCANCGSETMEVREIYSEIPRFGRMVIISMLCPKCGYRVNDSVSLESKGPKRIEFRVTRPEDLSARLIRSHSSHIKIPELGLELKPGPKSEAFITNVEGLLERFLQVVEQLGSTSGDDERERIERSIRKIRKAMQGEKPFTLIVEDEMGNSAVIPAEQFDPSDA
jgi:zinc finger protein